MNDQRKPRRAYVRRAYTGKTVMLPETRPSKPAPPPLPARQPDGAPAESAARLPLALPARTYENPPPSQRPDRVAPSGGQSGVREGKHAGKQTERPQRERQQKKTGMAPQRAWVRIRRTLTGLVLATMVIIGVSIGLFMQRAHAAAEHLVVSEVRSNPVFQTPLLGGTTVLLVGVDERPDHPEEGIRSDTLMVAHIDAVGRRVSLLSIPRDTQVELPAIGATKINVAYGEGYARAAELFGPDTTPQQGGMALSAQTVETLLGLRERGMRLDYVAQVNFDGFVNIIDALGGITVDVPAPLIDYAYPTPDLGTMTVEFQPGPQRMNGETALIYARTRHADSDFDRAARQQQVLQAIVSELQARSMPERLAALPDLLDAITGGDNATPLIQTTMPFDRPDMLFGLTLLASDVSPERIERLRITPETVAVTEIGSNLVWEEASLQQQVDRWLRHAQLE